MTTPFLQQDIERDEGLRLIAYPDPLTHAAPWTIGYGHTGREVHPGLMWTPSEAVAALVGDLALTCRGLDTALPRWRRLADLRQDVIANMAFNMGVHGLLNFKHMLAALDAGDFAEAADQMLASDWARQVGGRASRLALQLADGVRAG